MSKYCEISFKIALEKLPLIVGVLTQEVRDLKISDASVQANGSVLTVPARTPRVRLPNKLLRRSARRPKSQWGPMPTGGTGVVTMREFLRSQPVGHSFTGKQVQKFFEDKGLKPNNAWGLLSIFNHYRVIERTSKGVYRKPE